MTVCILIVQSLYIPAHPAFAMVYNPHPNYPIARHLYRKTGRRKLPIARISIPIPLPDFLYRGFRKIRDGLREPASPKKAAAVREPNLEGDRDIEWTWVSANMPSGPGRALDFGTGESNLAFEAALRGFLVTSIDLTPKTRFFAHSGVRYLQMDLLEMRLVKESLDLVINCSTVEHVGLSGRYGVSEKRPDGDLEAMHILRKALKRGGKMLLTIPVGKDEVFDPLCRVYGKERLPRLIKGFSILKEEYWRKAASNIWTPCSRAEALVFQASAGSWNYLENIYALGCLVLKKAGR
jgi:SAM-dependent methyltransferase